MGEKVLLIDGHSILNRAFYGLPDLTNSQGEHTGAVYGFLNILFHMIEEEKPDYLTVAFDVHAPTFRHKIYEAYKGTRRKMPDELREQVPLMKEMLAAMQMKIVEMAGYEADDLLGTLAVRSEKLGMDVTILSGDRDLLQLATDKIKIRLPKTSKGKTTIEDYHTQQVIEKYQVTPSQIVDLKAMMGDASDNIPGVPGIGEKTATKIIAEFGSVESAYEHIEEIKPKKARESFSENYEKAKLSKVLATIDTNSPLEYVHEDARVKNFYTKEAYALCKRLEFKNFFQRFDVEMFAENDMEDKFFVCRDFLEAEALFQRARQENMVGIAVLAEKRQVFGVAIAFSQEETYYIPAEGLLTGNYLCAMIQSLTEQTLLCAMDWKSLLKVMEIKRTALIFDAGVGAYLLNPLKSSYAYEELAKEYLGGKLLPSKEDLIGKVSFLKAYEEEMEGLEKLACYMAAVPLLCREGLISALQEKAMLDVYEKIELPLIFTLDSMEKYGIRIKGEELKRYGEELAEKIGELEQTIYKQAGKEFNINSPKQLGIVLFEDMGISGGKKTKTGYSTAADLLEKLAPQQPIIRDILEYRQLAKLKSTYADGLRNVIGEDGRIHSTFHQTITATGRLSSAEPNLQNIPVRMELGRRIRKVFVPEEGFVFLDADYSQIELRVLAHMSGDEKLIQAYKEAQDIHRLTASQVFHVPFEEVTDLQRRNAKAVNFGIVYGISSFGLSQDLSITRKEAAEYIEKYFETYPKIKQFLDDMVQKGKENGYVSTMFGRRRPIPELKSGNFMQKSFGERIAMNSPIQGTAADIIKIAMNRVEERLLKENMQSRLILQVHDELLIEAKLEEVDAVAAILEEEMKGAAVLSIDLDVDMHQGNSWYEAK